MNDTAPELTLEELKAEYDADLRRCGVAFSLERKAVYYQHLTDVTQLYRGQKKGFRRTMNEVYRRCGYSDGFLTFEAWMEKRP